ncbi:hypothetical protein [Aeromicrobium sp. WCS2018Hpa-33]|uniref:helix-turn-helix transcriptional regulator n=1 Tax=Aeromicrobium sp. WCS2018Hpa-33 TaxID=3073629 RepID=UPI0028833436|nr:hypothetical protein [Aeromicrobium sp. WCS2018Hpa-33]
MSTDPSLRAHRCLIASAHERHPTRQRGLVCTIASQRQHGTGAVMDIAPHTAACRPFLDPEAVAALLGVSRRHLDVVRAKDPSFPLPREVGSLPRWTYESLQAWVAGPSSEQLFDPTPAATPSEPVRQPRKRGAGRVH